MTRTETIETWINNELISIDIETAWAETFARWDALVSSELAVAIANAVTKELRRHALVEDCRQWAIDKIASNR